MLQLSNHFMYEDINIYMSQIDTHMKIYILRGLTIPEYEYDLNRYEKQGLVLVSIIRSWIHFGACLSFGTTCSDWCLIGTTRILVIGYQSAVQKNMFVYYPDRHFVSCSPIILGCDFKVHLNVQIYFVILSKVHNPETS